MFLKHIEIFGFKSFADKTFIELSVGITALLGPNGCGKSNIVDAIKWVLGEQSVRNMRAERMEDVIFSGTENRKALNVAEVSLTLENKIGILDLDYPEVVIKRRIFREGESEYFINGTPVRLKDVRELFFDTGIGKSAYSVMEQGRIDQVLSNRPEDRRHLFEEAAGITKYRVRGEEAERKLVRTEENIKQVQQILQEINKNYENLKLHTEKTLKYRQLKERSFELDRDLKLVRWKEIEANRDQRTMRLETKAKKHYALLQQIAEIKASMTDKLDAINEMEAHLIEHQKQIYGMELEKGNQDDIAKNIREHSSEIEVALQTSTSREQNAVEALKEIEKRKKSWEKDREHCQNHLKEIESGITLCGETIATTEERIRTTTDEITISSTALGKEEECRDALQSDLRTLTDTIVAELDTRLASQTHRKRNRDNLEERISSQLMELRIRVEGRSRLLGDQKNIAEHNKASEILHNASEDLGSLLSMIEELIQLFEECRSLGSDFLEDFLAPEGIITKKRYLDEQILASTEKIQSLKIQITTLNEEKKELLLKIQDTRNRLEEFRVAQARTATHAMAIEESLQSLTRETASEEKRLNEIREQRIAEEKQLDKLKKQTKNLAKKRTDLEKQQDSLHTKIALLEARIASEHKKMAGCEDSLKNLTEKRSSLEIDRERLNLQVENLNHEEQYLLEDFRDRHSRELEEFADIKTTIETKPIELKKEQSKLKNQLADIGRVNLMAPEEFKEVSERRNFLTDQLSDLQKAQKDLTKITEEILRESSEVFQTTFKQIHNNFHEMFRRLFGGGKAEVRLLQADDPLNSGLGIYAQPPGKKLENISLLSGGERSLCGIALLFATFMVKPSPFCILDEIDAALDENNVQRFINVLSDFSKKSQFIVITHNKKTVTGMQNLLGITMQESGVSRIISLKLDGRKTKNV